MFYTIYFYTEQCAEITAPFNGSVSSTTNGTTTYISVTCDLGYTLNGTAELMCLDNGSMSDQTPSCGMFCTSHIS